ncbi:MAG: hypothetical protein WEF86_07005 [Gemmatimonadota bacterium]
MISTSEIQRLIQRDRDGRDVLSLYLDMSVNSDNKRTYSVFLNKERARISELDSDGDHHRRDSLGAMIERVEAWIEESFEPASKGVAIFGEVGGDGFDAFQFPMPVRNRLEILPYPVIGPLAELAQTHHRYGVITVDREHLHLLSLHMGTAGEDYRIEPEAIPTPHDVQAGGYSHKDYQKRKAEEARQFFREFADEVTRFDVRVAPEFYVLLGTTENAQHFREFLSKQITDRIIHTAPAPPIHGAVEIRRQLQPVLEDFARQQEAAAFDLVQDRVRQSHFATAGVHDTLVQLQEGKVERLVVARDLEKDGVQCTKCGFYLVKRDGECPYCGGALRDGIDLVESMIRLAASQAVDIDFAPADTMRDMKGVAALLKF